MYTNSQSIWTIDSCDDCIHLDARSASFSRVPCYPMFQVTLPYLSSMISVDVHVVLVHEPTLSFGNRYINSKYHIKIWDVCPSILTLNCKPSPFLNFLTLWSYVPHTSLTFSCTCLYLYMYMYIINYPYMYNLYIHVHNVQHPHQHFLGTCTCLYLYMCMYVCMYMINYAIYSRMSVMNTFGHHE